VFTQSLSALHELPQLDPLQRYGEQLDVEGAEQAPAPLQNATGVKVVPLQDADPQVTLVPAWVQAPAPLQVPVFPQVPLALQRACGSVTVLATLAQVPALPVTLHAWQVGQLAVPQQTPSTQFPLPHS
jgi:alpha-D-ribose 1-methylphosphonate 5-triphosphate synthase subunit PhnH